MTCLSVHMVVIQETWVGRLTLVVVCIQIWPQHTSLKLYLLGVLIICWLSIGLIPQKPLAVSGCLWAGSLDLDELSCSHCRTNSGFLVLLYAVSEKMTVLSTVETESKPGWLTGWFPTSLATTTPSFCLSLGIGSWEARAPCTITHVVRSLAVLACICSVKGISWSRKSRRLCCHLSGEPFFTDSHHIGMSILGLQPEFLVMVQTPLCSQKLHKVIHWSCFWELLPHAVTEQHIISIFTLKLPAFIARKWNWCRFLFIPWIAALNWLLSSKPSATSPKFCSRRTSNSLTVVLGVIQKASSAKPKNFFFSDSQRSPHFMIARAWNHQVEKSTSPVFTLVVSEKGLNFLGLTGSHCSYSSSSSSLSWREVYTLSKVRRLAFYSRPPIFSFRGFRAFCRSSSSMRQGPTQSTKYHNEKCTKTDKLHKELPTSWRLLVAKKRGQNGGTYRHQRN